MQNCNSVIFVVVLAVISLFLLTMLRNYKIKNPNTTGENNSVFWSEDAFVVYSIMVGYALTLWIVPNISLSWKK